MNWLFIIICIGLILFNLYQVTNSRQGDGSMYGYGLSSGVCLATIINILVRGAA
jgi:hypothetical protein